MDVEQYIYDATVIKEINNVKQFLKENPSHTISDIVDEEGNQYVDLVQEGGGVLGIALLGYTYAMEELGIRFYNLGGTSAGAISTALLAAIDTPSKAKSIRILDILENSNLMDIFIDGGNDAIQLVKTISNKSSYKKITLVALRQLDDFFINKELGINRGQKFLDWLSDLFATYGIYNSKDILEKMNQFDSKLKNITNNTYYQTPAKLAIIASDITTQTKVEFPRMSNLYFKNPENASPALFVRASMSIPIVFDPVIINNLPKTKEHILDWQKIENAYYFGNIPEKVLLVDGGVMSNFPIDVFHVKKSIPTRPTFGVKLGYDRINQHKNESIKDIIWNSFTAAQQLRDHEFVIKNPDYIQLIANIDDKGVSFVDFNLPSKDKVELFVSGVVAACKFIKTFNWRKYKALRIEFLEKVINHNVTADIDSISKEYAVNFINNENN